MRYAVILAGGSGTRLWPLSRESRPKQLLPFIEGKSLLRIAYDRLDGLVDAERRYVCAGRSLRDQIRAGVPGLSDDRIIAEPVGRDTVNALALSCLVLARRDPDAVVAVFTADHLIRPEEELRATVRRGFEAVERDPSTLVTFGIAPTYASSAYGYLELGPSRPPAAWTVARFVEKPDAPTAARYLEAGADRYLWNSGMFVWKAATFLSCVKRFVPESAGAFERMSESWGTPRFEQVVHAEYPGLKKVSVDFAVMEPASVSSEVAVAALRLSAQWLDVGSWPSYALTLPADGDGNARGAGRVLLRDSGNCLVVSEDPAHLVAVLGCRDLIVIHSGDATLVCPRDRAQDVKQLRAQAITEFGDDLG
ncbi:MAG TPA: mannose-1-phosphate guanylyltransferase [Spirochaetia bacterium]|nr:mannose-1-phosphate guanylyltransferase [Spirochaetia bacterium]